MTVSQHPLFKPAYPEQFCWQNVDSPTLERIACALAAKTKHDLGDPDRVYVPGLRLALIQIAKEAIIHL